jgi:ribonuclease Z
MSIRVLFLGTAGSVPTPERSLPAVLIQREGEQLLFDCGEGVQRQMIKAKTGFHKKMKVFISHLHGDHILGLPGLLQTMALLDRQAKLDIYGPPGIEPFLESVRENVQFVLTFPVEIHEVQEAGAICEENEYTVRAVWANHVIPSLAYVFAEKPRPRRFYPARAKALGVPEGPLWSKLQHGHNVKSAKGEIVRPEEVTGASRPGRKIVYTGDTRPIRRFVKFAAGADLLIHDATLGDELSQRAEEDGHSTPSQAAREAKKAKVKKLILTHISARYKDTSMLLKQARKVFRNVQVAKDFMEMEIPLPDN